MSQATAPYTHHAGDVAPRVPISLRLPPQIISEVDRFASANHLTKTDAFVYFVQKGMDGHRAEPQTEKLDAISMQLQRIESLLHQR